MVSWNLMEVYKHYKDIKLTCVNEGYLLPFRLVTLDVPKEYDFSRSEWDGIIEGLSDDVYSSIYDAMIVRRRKELELFRDRGDDFYSLVEQFYDDELDVFLRRFPKFKGIVG